MSISKLTSFAVSAYQPTSQAQTSKTRRDFAAVRQTVDQAAATASSEAASSASNNMTGTTAATASVTAVDTFTRRQQIFGVKPPVLTDAPDADGRTGSYRRMVEGIDPRVPGHPGYADYYGLGGTAAVADQAERNKNVTMGFLVNPATLRA